MAEALAALSSRALQESLAGEIEAGRFDIAPDGWITVHVGEHVFVRAHVRDL
jgi:hypothetical protein